MIIKHDDLCARAWECEHEMQIFDADDHNTAPPDPPEFLLQSDLPPEETWHPPGTSRDCSLESFPSADGLFDGTDRYRYTERDKEMGLEQHHPIPTNPCSSNYDLRHNPKLNCNNDYRY